MAKTSIGWLFFVLFYIFLVSTGLLHWQLLVFPLTLIIVSWGALHVSYRNLTLVKKQVIIDHELQQLRYVVFRKGLWLNPELDWKVKKRTPLSSI